MKWVKFRNGSYNKISIADNNKTDMKILEQSILRKRNRLKKKVL